MWHRTLVRHVLVTIAAVCATLIAMSASAQGVGKVECADAYQSAQELRAAGDLTSSLEALLICAQATCPQFIQADCATWLTEVQQEVPSVVFSAKSASGEDATAVSVSMDGKRIAERLDGKPVLVNPGTHTFVLEMAGEPPVEKQILIKQGEQNRVIEVSFAPDSMDQTEVTASPNDLRTYAFVAGGVGALGLVSFAVFGLVGQQQEKDLDTQCPERCPEDLDDRKSEIRQKYAIADVSLIVGVVGVVTGAVLYLASEPPAIETSEFGSVRLDVGARHDAAFTSLSGAF